MFKKALAVSLLMTLSMTVFAQKYRAYLTTNYGTIVIKLFKNTPKTTKNFVKLCKEHFYDSLLFHRVIPGFMIQGGDPNSKHAKPGQRLGSGDVGYKVPAEFRKENFHQRGALAMARDNNPKMASSGCQFYIVEGKKYTKEKLEKIAKRTGHKFTDKQMKIYETKGGAPFLDGRYTVFGQIIKGMDIVDKIAHVKRDKFNRPKKNQRLLKVRVKKKFLFFWL